MVHGEKSYYVCHHKKINKYKHFSIYLFMYIYIFIFIFISVCICKKYIAYIYIYQYVFQRSTFEVSGEKICASSWAWFLEGINRGVNHILEVEFLTGATVLATGAAMVFFGFLLIIDDH